MADADRPAPPPEPEEALRLQRLERVLAGSRDGYWERDLRSELIWYSPSFMAMLGLAPGQLGVARGDATARVHPDDRARFVAAHEGALAGLGGFAYEIRFLDGAGQWRWVRGRGKVWPDADGRPAIICGAATDVHEQVLARQQLDLHRHRLEALVAERTAGLEAALALAEERRQEAERANAAKSRFLAHMSHEIRTPLNGVLGLTELALRGPLHADQRRYLEVAAQSGQALLRVISDVLDFSRIEAGHVELRPQPLDLPQLLVDTVRAVIPLVKNSKVLVMFDYLGDAEAVVADAGVLRQVVTNLLGNAAKFTEQGSIRLTAQTRAAGPGLVEVRVHIADSGPGVPPERRASVFDAFVQADDSLARGHGGTGLGLAIASTLAQAMGGAISLDCPAGGGSVFTLTLCLPAAPEAARPAMPAPELAWMLHSRPTGGAWLGGRLSRLGWRFEALPDIASTVERLRAHPEAERPRLVLIAEGGLALARHGLQLLREALPDATIRLLVRADWHDPPTEALAQSLGISTLLGPMAPAVLRQVLSEIAERARPSVDSAGPPLRRDAEVLLVEDNPVNQLIGTEFLRALGLRARVADDGQQALDACLERAPALVLMDLQMPGMDGLEATRRLRELQHLRRWPGAPIVALTAHASEADRSACLAAGMDGVLTKPLSLETLHRQLARWLGA